MEHQSICFVAPKAPPIGGIATWFSIVLKSIEQKYDIYHINSSVDVNEYSSANRSRIKRFFYKFIRLSKNISEAKRVFQNNRIDVLHIATSGGFGFFRDYKIAKIAKQHDIKVCIHLHFGRIPEILSNKSIENYLLIKALKYCDSVICMDDSTFMAMKQIFDKVYLVNNPINLLETSDCIHSHEFSFVGTLNRNKGIYELLSVYDFLINNNEKFLMKLIGPIDDNEKKEIFEEISKHDPSKLIITGELSKEKVLQELKKSRFSILLSKTEGMPYSILESMSMGVPILSTDVGSIKKVVNGCGIVVNPKISIEELGKTITLLLHDDEIIAKYSKEAISKIRTQYSTDVVIQQLSNIWFGGLTDE